MVVDLFWVVVLVMNLLWVVVGDSGYVLSGGEYILGGGGWRVSFGR